MLENFIVVFAHIYCIVSFLAVIGTIQIMQKEKRESTASEKINFYLLMILISAIVTYWISK